MKNTYQLQKVNQIWFFNKLITWLQKVFIINDSPEKIARGFALGTFIGMTPFFGLHFFISVVIAKILNWNKIAAGVAVFHTNIFTGTFIIGINYTIGAAIIGSDSLLFEMGNGESLFYQILTSGSSLFVSLLIGGLVTGIPAAILSYFFLKLILIKKHSTNILTNGNN